VPGQPADARKHLHRCNVKVWTFPTPSLNDGVDLVRGWLAGHIEILDVKSLDVENYWSGALGHALLEIDLPLSG
jgi:hypothetical protein